MTPVMKILKSVPVSWLRGWSTLLVLSITFWSDRDLNISMSLERVIAMWPKTQRVPTLLQAMLLSFTVSPYHAKLGLIQEVILGADGLPRCVLIRVANRDKQHTLLKRAVQLLYPLEISQPEHLDNTSWCTPSAQPQLEETLATREPLKTREPIRCPVWVAAKKAAEKRRMWVEELQTQD